MKKKIKIILVIIFIIFVFNFIYFEYINSKNTYVDEFNVTNKINNGISLNIEQTAGMGDYKMVTQSNWPTDGYKFNAELSRCENDGELSWDDTNKIVVMSGNVSDKCYVYFDVWIPTIADYCANGDNLSTCVKNFGDQGSDISNIYIHNSSLANGAGDNSYRYAGPSEEVNNFVCFGSDATPCPTDNLYRIIGVFGENYHGVSGKQLVKLIKYDYANSNLLGTNGDYYSLGVPDISTYKGKLTSIDSYYWNFKANNYGGNEWSTSLLNKTNLNTNYINNIGSTWASKIATINWKVGGNTSDSIQNSLPALAYKNEVGSSALTTTNNAKVGLMYASDYGFAVSPSAWTATLNSYDGSVNETTIRSLNWMYMGFTEWTISRSTSTSLDVLGVYKNGRVFLTLAGNNGTFSNVAVRVSFFFLSSITYQSGTGTMDEPIRIN